MVDGLYILIQDRTKKPLAIVLSGAERESMGRDGGIQNKHIWNCYYEFTCTVNISRF
jgi:hypothetical protein